jgi:hypothetical protein
MNLMDDAVIYTHVTVCNFVYNIFFILILVFVSRYSNNEMCKNSGETRKLKANVSNEFLHFSIEKKKKNLH